MSPLYVEMGTGVSGAYTTQNFGSGSPDTSGRIAMGVHEPEQPRSGDEVLFWVDYQGASGATVQLWLDGTPYPMTLEYGSEDSGVWVTEQSMPSACSAYYFSWEKGSDSGVFPQTGSYLMGKDCTGLWVDEQREDPGEPQDSGDPTDSGEPSDPGTDDPRIGDGNGPNAEQPGGCSSLSSQGGAPFGAMALLAGALLLRRRRNTGTNSAER